MNNSWISVDDELPPPYKYNPDNVSTTVVTASKYNDEWRYATGSYWYKIQHWAGDCQGLKVQFWMIPPSPDDEEEIPVWESAFDRMPNNERSNILHIADQLGKRQYFNALNSIAKLMQVCVQNMGTLSDERNKQIKEENKLMYPYDEYLK